MCYIRIDPHINVWHKETVLRKGVPDSNLIDVDGHQYHQNKRDLTLVPLNTRNEESDESDGHGHQDNREQPMRTAVRPTLHPRQTLKFPRLPVQVTEQKDFKL